MLSRDQRKLFTKVLDDLDRVFDWYSSAAELHSSLISAAEALRESRFAVAFQSAADEVRKVAAIKLSKQDDHNLKLDRTDGLRAVIAEELDIDARENPKGRHNCRYGNSE